MGEGRASYLDAASVEPGVLAEEPHHGDVGGLVLHQLHEDDACGILLLKHLHGLLQVVLTVEGAGGREEQGRGLQEVIYSPG